MRRLIVATESGVAIYVGEGGDISQLVGVPVPLTRGAAICKTDDTCGTWERYDLSATTATTTTAIAHGASSKVGDYFIVHGGYAQQTTANTTCADWFVADVHVAAVRTN